MTRPPVGNASRPPGPAPANRGLGRTLALTLTLALGACQTQAAPLDRDRCEALPDFRFISAGDFIAGSDAAERDYGYTISAAAVASTPADIEAAEARLRDRRWFDREGDRRTETLPALCIQANLVTQADYAEFVAATGHRAPDISAADYQTQGFLVHPYEEVEPYRWQQDQPPADKTDHPVVLVSYDDALAYAAWKGQQDGITYRLPTALEWEKAARGTAGDYFPWGNDWQPDATHWGQSRPFGTAAIAAYPLSRSVYGVEDMAGNVFEYTATLRDTNRGRSSVMKGCSWDDLPGFCRAAYEHTRPVNSRHILFGFRLVVHTDRPGTTTQIMPKVHGPSN
jgi:formylglycine-generating enzyme required for sulfatase activity